MTLRYKTIFAAIVASTISVAVAAPDAASTNAKVIPANKPATVVASVLADANRPLKIGFVNTEKILSESEPAKEAQRKLEAEFKQREADFQKQYSQLRAKYEQYDKNVTVMTNAQSKQAEMEIKDMETDLQRKRREIQEDFNRRRNEAIASVVDKANAAIRDLADKEGYDLILQDAVTVSKRIDITDKVIALLNSKK